MTVIDAIEKTMPNYFRLWTHLQNLLPQKQNEPRLKGVRIAKRQIPQVRSFPHHNALNMGETSVFWCHFLRTRFTLHGYPSYFLKPAFSLRFQRHKGHRISLETFWFGLEQKHQKGSEWCTQTETANPSSEKMTTVARVIGLKGMPMGKRLWGHFPNLETTA